MKDTARLLAYFGAIVLFGALSAPPLFWFAQALAAHGVFPDLATFDFETFFHRSLLLGAVVFLWPLLRSLHIAGRRDLGLETNPNWKRDLIGGFLLAAIPLFCCAIILLQSESYSMRTSIRWAAFGSLLLTSAVVPLLEEGLFRGLFLGVLLRSHHRMRAIFLVSALFSILHFLKAPEGTTKSVSWISGFVSIAHAFEQFTEPVLLLAAFTTLFLIGWILADARVRTRSLWLSIGLHAGWIFVSGAFNKIAHRDVLALPWLGKSLLVGIVPLCLGLVTWATMLAWLKYVDDRKT